LSSYVADCSKVSDMPLSEPRLPPSYVQRDRFAHNPSGYLPFTCQARSIKSPTSLLTSRTPVMDSVATDYLVTVEPWTDFLEAAELPTDCLSAAPPSMAVVSSTFCSPLQSARGAKRRAASSSTLSSDILPDIVSMIRQSPNEITTVGDAAGRPATSSTQWGRLVSGSISHLSARNGASVASRARRQHLTTAVDDLDNPLSTVMAMYNLENEADDDLDSNQVVVRQNDNFMRGAVVTDYCHQQTTAQFAALGEFSCQLPSSMQDLEEIEQLERFLQVSAAVNDDADGGRVRPPPPYGVAVASVDVAARDDHSSSSVGGTTAATAQDGGCDVPLVCLWLNCGQLFFAQDQLVQHIEQHVDQRCTTAASSTTICDEYICQWTDCSRQCRPFNARYKLLIHMRVHSGEKPHKCTVPRHYYTHFYCAAQCMQAPYNSYIML